MTSWSVSSTRPMLDASGTRCARALGGVCADVASGQDPPDGVRPPGSGEPSAARAWQAGDLRVPGLYLHLWQDASRSLPDLSEDPPGPHAGEAPGDQGGAATADAPAHSPAGAMAEAGRHRLRRLPCCADQQSCLSGVPLSHCRPLATHASATQPEGWFDVGENSVHRQRLAPEATHPSPLAAAAFCRQTPKVGAECPNGARSDLCGGRSVMGVPTAIQLFIRWAHLGVWERLLLLAQERGGQRGMTFLDGTSIRAHHKAAGAEKRGPPARRAMSVRRWAARVAGMGPRRA